MNQATQLTGTTPTGADETYTVSTVVTDTAAPRLSSIERYSPSSATTDSQTLIYEDYLQRGRDWRGCSRLCPVLWTVQENAVAEATPSPQFQAPASVYSATVSATTDGTYNLDLVSSGHGIEDESSNSADQHGPHRSR